MNKNLKQDLEIFNFSLQIIIDNIEQYLQQPGKDNRSELLESYVRASLYANKVREMFSEEELDLEKEFFNIKPELDEITNIFSRNR